MMMMLVKFWRPLAVAALLLVLAVAWRVDRATQYQAGEASATAKISAELAKTVAKQQDAANIASADYQAAKAAAAEKERVQYVQVQKIVERPVYRNVCIDDDGLLIINSAIAGSD